MEPCRFSSTPIDLSAASLSPAAVKAEFETSAATPPPPAADLPPARPPMPDFRPLWSEGLEADAQAQTSWLWQGFLKPGNVTLLTSQWKSGKTTLLAVLLARMKSGGLLAGLPVRPGKAVVVSEESVALWADRCRRLSYGNHVCFLCRPFTAQPSPDQWRQLIAQLGQLHQQHDLSLVVIDPLAPFLPGHSENVASAMLDALRPLQALAAQGPSVVIAHHPRKGEVMVGQAARGSGALLGHVDIQLEMNWYGRPTDNDRRRRLYALSRFDETPKRLLIELTADGTDWIGHGPLEDDADSQPWQAVLAVLAQAEVPLDRHAILAAWPADRRRPNQATLWRWLAQAVAAGLVRVDGTGRKGSPFRYQLGQASEE